MFDFTKTTTRRVESAKSVAESPKTDPVVATKIKRDISITQYMSLGTFLSELVILGLLYKRGIFNSTSAYYWKEASTVVGLISYDLMVDRSVSNWFWERNQQIVKEFAREREKEFFALKKTANGFYKQDKEDRLYD